MAFLGRVAIPRFSAANATPKKVMDALRTEGCAIIERLIPESRMVRISHELEPHLVRRALTAEGGELGLAGHGDFMGNRTKRMLGVLGKSPTMCELAAHPMIVSVADTMLKPYCERIQLHIGMFRRLCPGEDKQALHQDRHSIPAMDLKPSLGEPGYFPGAQYGIGALWALSDCTEMNGATRVIPRSHLRTDVNLDMTLQRTSAQEHEIGWVPTEEECILATMPRGSVLLYPSVTVHGASANETDEVRDVCLFAYSPAWVRQEENMFLTTPPEVAVNLPTEVQELLGYSLHGEVLGMVDVNGDMGNPQQLLENQKGLPLPLPPAGTCDSMLPILNVHDWRSRQSRHDFAASLRRACERSGFFYLVGHGLDEKLDRAQKALLRFFEQPEHIKAKVGTSFTRVFPQNSRGWVAEETLDPSQQGILDLKESFEVGLEKPQELDPKAKPFDGPNNWPTEVPELQQDYMAAVHALHELSLEIATALEVSLGVELGTFTNKCEDPMLLCRGLYYKTPQGKDVDETGALGCSAHTDYGVISLLHQTGPGLQVLHADQDKWIDAVPVQGALVVNLGDLMQRWTNGKFKSTLHRVVPPAAGHQRQCIGFFLDANFDSVIEPLSACLLPGEAPRYSKIKAGDHKLAKFNVQAGSEVAPEVESFFQRTLNAPK